MKKATPQPTQLFSKKSLLVAISLIMVISTAIVLKIDSFDNRGSARFPREWEYSEGRTGGGENAQQDYSISGRKSQRDRERNNSSTTRKQCAPTTTKITCIDGSNGTSKIDEKCNVQKSCITLEDAATSLGNEEKMNLLWYECAKTFSYNTSICESKEKFTEYMADILSGKVQTSEN